MTTNERTQTSIDTFITPATEAGGITLRPFSAGIRAREVMRRMEREPDVAAAKRECAPKPHMTPEAFATRLRSWRKARRLTQPVPPPQSARSAWSSVMARGPSGNAVTKRRGHCPCALCWLRVPVLRGLRQPAPTSSIRPHREMPMCPRKFRHLLRRKARGLNQAEALVVLGLSADQALLSSYERSRFIPRPARMSALLAVITETEVQP